ncbi:MAG: YdbH domain-containing protein [Nitrospirales bacterium]
MATTTRLARVLWWSIPTLILILLIFYASVPALLNYFITRTLETRGMTDVKLIIAHPGWNSWQIPLLSFQYSNTSFPLDLQLEQIEIRYSYQSLKNGLLDQMTIGPSHMIWQVPRIDQEANQEEYTDIQTLTQGGNIATQLTDFPSVFFPLSVLKIEELSINHSQDSSSLQHTILQGTIQNRGGAISGLLRFHRNDIPTYIVQFDVNQSGTLSALIGQDQTPSHPALTITTHILPVSSEYLSHQGGVQIELESLVTFATSLFPLAPEFHDLSGTFTADWMGKFPVSSINPERLSIEGNFSLDYHLPTFSPQLHNLHTFSNGAFTWADNVLNLLIAPATKGTVDWVADSTTLGYFAKTRGQHLTRSWQWHISQPIGVVIPFTDYPPALDIHAGQIKVAMANLFEDLTLTLDLASIHWDQPSGMSGKAIFHTAGHLGSLEQDSVLLDDLTWGMKGELAYSSDDLHLHLYTGTRLASKGIHTPAFYLPQVEGILRQPMSLQVGLPSLNWKIQPFGWDINLHTLTWKNLAPWNIKRLALNISILEKKGPDWLIEGGVQLNEFGLSLKGQKFPKVNAILDFSGNAHDVTIQYAIRGLPALFLIKGTVQVSPDIGSGKGTLVLSPLIFQPGSSTLRSFLQPWPWPLFDIRTGTLSSSIDMTWTRGKTQSPLPINIDRLQGFLRLDDLGGYLKNTIFDGLEGHVALLGDQNSLTLAPSPIRLRQLQAAIPLSNISAIVSGSMTFSNPQTTLTIRQGTVYLLGGRVTAAPVTLKSTQASHQLLLSVEEMSLAHILELEQQNSVKGTGSLSGSIPVTMTFSDIEIQNGSLKARPPGGVLHVDMSRSGQPSWLKSQPNVDLLIQSLKNFHYHTLNVGLDYQKNGTLQLDTRIEGNNPDFKSGRPIHFNLKIEENIPALLQSLELVQGIEKSIQQMIPDSKVRPPQPRDSTH